MGEQQLDVVTSDTLHYVPVSEFARLRGAGLNPVDYARAFAALARINTLYMIAQAWSGHIGTSFSSLEIMSWLFLNELRDLDKGPDGCDLFFSSKGHDAPALYSVLIGARPAGRREAPPAAATARAARASSCRDAVHPGEHRIARDGHLEGQRHGARRSACAARSRSVFVLTGDGELQEGQFWESLPSAVHLGPARDRRRDRPQQDPVRHVGERRQRPRRPRSEARGVRLARQRAATATTRPRSRRLFRALDAGQDAAQGRDRRHREGQGRVVHGRAGDAPAAICISTTRARRTKTQYARGSQELIDAAQTLLRALASRALAAGCARSGAAQAGLAVQPRRGLFEGAASSKPERNPHIVALDADLVKDCGLLEFRERISRPLRRVRHRRAGHGVDGLRHGAPRRAAGRALVRVLPVRAAQRADLQPVQRVESSHATSGRWPVCFPAGPVTRISRFAISRRWAPCRI